MSSKIATAPTLSGQSSAAEIACVLKARGVSRVFALCGGHIMPIWMRLHAEGINIVDVRDERAAVHMAHAHAELTGTLGVALVTAGPGVTNAITGIANADVGQASILVLSGLPPTAQQSRGALQDITHTSLLGPITRYASTVRHSALVLQELDRAIAHAFGEFSCPGPSYLDFPIDILRAEIPRPLVRDEHIRPKPRRRLLPDPSDVNDAAELIGQAHRVLVISGRGARGAGDALTNFLNCVPAAYLDTGESRGVVPESHPSVVAAMRGRVLGEADLVITIGRRFDFQLAYGSPAIFGTGRLLRISNSPSELADNRRGDVELLGTPSLVLDAIVDALADRSAMFDTEWRNELHEAHQERSRRLAEKMASSPCDDQGRMHPNRLLSVLRDRLPEAPTVIADGGDFLSFARVGLPARDYLDPGSLGCLGVGVPFGIAASLAQPDRTVVVATGDGAFGFNAMEVDTAVRHGAPVLIVVANNGAWQIETHDQHASYGEIVGSRLRFSDYAQMARSFGMYAERIDRVDALAVAIDRALENLPALLDVVVTPEAISADASSGLAWVPDLQPIAAWDNAERIWRDQG